MLPICSFEDLKFGNVTRRLLLARIPDMSFVIISVAPVACTRIFIGQLPSMAYGGRNTVNTMDSLFFSVTIFVLSEVFKPTKVVVLCVFMPLELSGSLLVVSPVSAFHVKVSPSPSGTSRTTDIPVTCTSSSLTFARPFTTTSMVVITGLKSKKTLPSLVAACSGVRALYATR